MSKGARKFTGFLWAMLLAVLSFFIIFIFFQDVSQRFFGVSIKNPKKLGETVSKAVTDAVSKTADKVNEAVTGAVDKVVDKAAEAAAKQEEKEASALVEEAMEQAQTD